MGAPTVMTQEVIDKLEQAFLLGCTDIEACLAADIAEKTLYNYQEKHPEFLQRKNRLKENPVYKARRSVVNALDKDPDLALKYLERKKKMEFSLRSEITGADGEALTTPTVRIIDERVLKKPSGDIKE